MDNVVQALIGLHRVVIDWHCKCVEQTVEFNNLIFAASKVFNLYIF